MSKEETERMNRGRGDDGRGETMVERQRMDQEEEKMVAKIRRQRQR